MDSIVSWPVSGLAPSCVNIGRVLPHECATCDARAPTAVDSCAKRQRWLDRLQSNQRFPSPLGPGEVLCPSIALGMK